MEAESSLMVARGWGQETWGVATQWVQNFSNER